MTTPYEAYEMHKQGSLEKEAMIGALAGVIGGVARAGGMMNLAGMGLKGVGKAMAQGGIRNFNPFASKGGLMQRPTFGNTAVGKFGEKVHNMGRRLDVAGYRFEKGIDKVLNKGPGWNYGKHVAKLPEPVRHGMNFVGFNTRKGQTLTAQRAALWGGEAYGMHEGLKFMQGPEQGFQPQMPQPVHQPQVLRPLEPIEPKMIYQQAAKQAKQDFETMIRRMAEEE